ncbi:MAG: sugar phosphate isomerase/epimerase [Ruminococcaceae bacterium]|jgi:sugar phosphate isomerase/epimerase|nr:sugar phosphate isomerase/epimerase [Oscillospiraceae bacterium]
MDIYANTWCYRDASRETAFRSIARLGYAGVEIIAHPPCWHADILDTTTRRKESLRLISELGLSVVALSPNTEYLVFDEEKRRQAIEHTMAMIDLTRLYGVNLTRIFAGGRFPENQTKDACIEAVIKALKPCAEYAESREVVLAVESHGQFGTDIEALAVIINEIDSPSLGITLDTSNFAVNGVDPLRAIDVFNGRIYHTHLKDSLLGEKSIATAVGEGSLDFPAIIQKLNETGYRGAFCVEYEGSEPADVGLAKSLGYIRKLFA